MAGRSEDPDRSPSPQEHPQDKGSREGTGRNVRGKGDQVCQRFLQSTPTLPPAVLNGAGGTRRMHGGWRPPPFPTLPGAFLLGGPGGEVTAPTVGHGLSGELPLPLSVCLATLQGPKASQPHQALGPRPLTTGSPPLRGLFPR